MIVYTARRDRARHTSDPTIEAPGILSCLFQAVRSSRAVLGFAEENLFIKDVK